jgi:hypothetical protein
MRAMLMASLAAAALVSAARAEPYVKSNDTGGIISWSCEAEAFALQIAGAACARFDKYPRITSVHRQYGDYIAFQCLWNPRQSPFAIPAVRTRTACYGHTVRVAY